MNKPKVSKPKMIILTFVFVWILICNVLVHLLEGQLEHLPFSSWSFFLSVTFYFLLHEVEMKKRLLHVFCGGAVGILFACALCAAIPWLMGLGLSHGAAKLIPLALILAALILLNPIAPMFFNNVGFGYFIVALINSSEAVSRTPAYLISLAVGTVVLNVVSCVIVQKGGEILKKKAIAKAAAQKEAAHSA